MFDSILGHEPIKAYLEKALLENRLPNTLLFAGMEGIGKRKLAYALAAHLLRTDSQRIEGGNHPDFHLIVPEGKSGLHSIELLRKVMGEAHEAPFESPAKVFLIDAAERMQPAAANALLKTLEEPTLDSYWILVTSSLQEILPTILSRCAKLHFQPLTDANIIAILHQHNLSIDLAKFAHGSAGKAMELVQHPEIEEARKILFSLLSMPVGYPKLSQSLEAIEKLLETEDPLLRSRRAAHLFSSIALYFRDQEADVRYRFFPEAAPIVSAPHRWEEALDRARLAFERNLKLSTCLESLLLNNLNK
jgi:DNA polymerase-3 subunit delta'